MVDGHLSALEPEIGPPYHFADALEKLGAGEVNRELPWSTLTQEQQAFQAAKMEVHAAMVDRMDQEIGQWPAPVAGENVPPPPGQSLLPAFQEDAQQPRTLWWFHEDNRALRQGNYKLVAAKDEPWQLYDLSGDRMEEANLITGLPEKAAELQPAWERITDEIRAQ